MQKIEYYIRSYIKTSVTLGKSATEITKDLKVAHDRQDPKYRTVAKWTKLFREGKYDLEDDTRSRRPRTALTNSNIELVRLLFEDNPHLYYNENEAATSINQFSIHQIIYDHLKMKKLTSR